MPKKLPSTSGGTASAEKVQMQIEVEYFDVLHTKHLHQRNKIWEDGFLEYHVVPQKLILYANNTRMSLLDSKFCK